MAPRHGVGSTSPELVGLRGKRWVEVSESPEDGDLSVERVKWITGGDRITGRMLYANPVTFEPTHTVSLFSNHAPRVRDDGHAIWRRLLMISWDVVIPDDEQDRELAAKILARETGGVLRWILDGARAYLAEGLVVPESVARDTAAYRDAEDFFGTWLDECCSTDAGDAATARAGKLMESYRRWAAARDAPALRDQALAERLAARGFKRTTRRRAVSWIGLRLLEAEG